MSGANASTDQAWSCPTTPADAVYDEAIRQAEDAVNRCADAINGPPPAWADVAGEDVEEVLDLLRELESNQLSLLEQDHPEVDLDIDEVLGTLGAARSALQVLTTVSAAWNPSELQQARALALMAAGARRERQRIGLALHRWAADPDMDVGMAHTFSNFCVVELDGYPEIDEIAPEEPRRLDRWDGSNWKCRCDADTLVHGVDHEECLECGDVRPPLPMDPGFDPITEMVSGRILEYLSV